MERRSFLESLIAALAGSVFARGPASAATEPLPLPGGPVSCTGFTMCIGFGAEGFTESNTDRFVPMDPVVKSRRRKNKKSHRRRRQEKGE